jgi:hypothetical protein
MPPWLARRLSSVPTGGFRLMQADVGAGDRFVGLEVCVLPYRNANADRDGDGELTFAKDKRCLRDPKPETKIRARTE